MSDDLWSTELAAELQRRRLGGEAEAEAFAQGIPASYREATPATEAAADLVELSLLQDGDAPGGGADGPEAHPGPGATRAPAPTGGRQRFAVRAGEDKDTFRLRRYGERSAELTSFLPLLQSFGVTVLEAVPHRLIRPDGTTLHLDDYGLRVSPEMAVAVDVVDDGPRLIAALGAVLDGEAEVDSLNRLVLAAKLEWREVGILRAYRRYRRQAGIALSDQALADALVVFPGVARALLTYFSARFDPDGDGPGGETAARARRDVIDAMSDVVHLEQDQVLRSYLALIDATMRTNWFCRDPLEDAPSGPGRPAASPSERTGRHRPTLVLKLDSRLVPGLGLPRPLVETFVYAPAVEGIHLRAGRVARGGIRWSEREDDLRAEVLDLAAAQVKKNAIIVPTGAKGGFTCRSQPSQPEVRGAYALFVAGLLDITDNVIDGRVVTPPGVMRSDEDDPYLVVAADRGTATFSDLANQISRDAGFWLDDAFASGGSSGYDHKAMGITARGAWKAVQRHFRQLGIDVQRDAVRVAGVGDMSGDVFGNGMLLSRTLRLVAAFDHRHVFVDPDPDPEASFEERARLARLPGSSWDDYDRRVLSDGGGVWRRDAARVELTPTAQAALGCAATEMSPLDLISVILCRARRSAVVRRDRDLHQSPHRERR